MFSTDQKKTAEVLRQQCGDTAGTMRKDCGDAAETVRKDYGVVTMRKYRGNNAERLRRCCGNGAERLRGSADIVRTKCGTRAVPLRTRRRSALLGHHTSLNAAATSCRMRPRTDSSVMVIGGAMGPLSLASDMGQSPARLLTTKKQG